MTTCLPNRATSAGTYVLISEEDTWGTDGGHTPYGIEFARETLRTAYDAVDQQHQMSAHANAAVDGYLTDQNAQGEIRGELQPHGPWPLIWKHALGGQVVTGGSYPYVHTIKAINTLPTGLTIEKWFSMRDSLYQWRKFLGCKVNQVFLHVNREGPVTARCAVLAREMTSGDQGDESLPTATWPTQNEPFETFHASILLDYAAAGDPQINVICKNIDLTVDNGLQTGRSPSAGNKRYCLLPGLRKIGGSVTAFFTNDDAQEWLDAWKANTLMQLRLTLTKAPWSWEFYLPAVRLRGSTPQIADKGPVNIRVPFVAEYDATYNTDLQVTITNNDPSIMTEAA